MTLNSPIFRKLLWSAFLPTAVTLLVLDFYLTRYMAQRQVANLEQRLVLEARMLGGEVSGIPSAGLEEWAKQAQDRVEARVTLIEPGGRVVADSWGGPETVENQADRPEVVDARRFKVGASIRPSATLGRELCYVALLINYHAQIGYVLRLAMSLEDVDAASAAVGWRILSASMVAAVLALGIALFSSRSFTHRIDLLRIFAEGLGSARFAEGRLPELDNDELSDLARSLRQTAIRLRELVDTLSLESARRETILASMVEGVLAVDHEMRVTFCNDSFARLVGVAPPASSAKVPLLEVVRDPGLVEILQRVLASGVSFRQRLLLPAAQGRAFEVQAAPLAEPSRRGAIAILHDITDLERLERVRKDFVANVSHELRTPLTAIRGYAETLLEGALEDREHNRKFVEIIKAHATRLNNIASDLLALSELESGKPPELERVSIRDVLEAALNAVEPEAQARGVHLVWGKIEDCEVLGHRLRLEQALFNLLDNGVKFNRRSGEVRVEAGVVPDDGVCITIADTGVGIPSGDLSRIFERFYRVDRARSREVGGTGLGLSIVKHVVERMNGTVTVESQLGKGSKFTLRFPTAGKPAPASVAS